MRRTAALFRFFSIPLWLALVVAGVALVLMLARPGSMPTTTLEDGLGAPVVTQSLTL